MKKFLALILATMMVLSCAVAMAADFEIREEDDKYTTTDKSIDSPKTELWLQVDAQGQIDVTVPLVLVFKTNIDGGVASTADTYKITNNSTADLVVTSIATTKVDKSDSQPMTMVAYNATPGVDQYKAQLSVADAVTKGTPGQGDTTTNNTGAYDLNTTAHGVAAINGGLFELVSGNDTVITADMTTGKLSFVTHRTNNDQQLDTTQGVKLLTVTYTVAIDTSDAIGEKITDNGDNTVNGTEATNP